MQNQNRTRSRDESDAWRLDPSDVARHARLRRRSEQPGALARVLRYSIVVLVLAGAVAVYWNFDTLRHVTVEAPALSALLKPPSSGAASVRASGASDESAVVESSAVAGAAAPTSVSSKRDGERPVDVAKAEAPAATKPKPPEAPVPESASAARSASAEDGVPAARSAPAEDDVPAARSAPAEGGAPAGRSAPASDGAPPVESASVGTSAAESKSSKNAAAAAAVEQPATPETISFALPKFTVSESDASAAVLVARSGGNRGPSAFTWWTSDGTAKAGKDYVDLGRVVVKFAAGEQNRAIHIPIVGDQVAEGPESFYVNLAPGEDASAEPQDRVEVVIEDDDKP